MTDTSGTNAPATPDPPRSPADEAMRASDVEREAALRDLGRHYAAGRLDRAEFDERSDAAFAARTRADLRRLFADLPGGSPGRDETSASALASAPTIGGWTDPSRSERFVPVARGPFAAVPAAVFVVLAGVLVAFAVTVVTRGGARFPFPLIPILFILSRRPWRRNRKAGS